MRGIHTIRDAGEMRGITNANFSYDAAGNLTASPVGYSYTWNAEGRMATAVAGGVTYTYTYNGDGQRVKKAAASSSSYDKLYWYGLADNGGSQVLAESALDGTLTSEYIFMGATRIARRDVSSGSVYYFLGDRLGNARVVTNSTGGIVEESDFLPYGTERTITDSLDNNYKFTGHERDGETSLDHTLFRQFSSTQGRWLSIDPVKPTLTQSTHSCPATTSVMSAPEGVSVPSPQRWNRYAYVSENPVNLVDTWGRDEVDPDSDECQDAVANGVGFIVGDTCFIPGDEDYYQETEPRSLCFGSTCFGRIAGFTARESAIIMGQSRFTPLDYCLAGCVVGYGALLALCGGSASAVGAGLPGYAGCLVVALEYYSYCKRNCERTFGGRR